MKPCASTEGFSRVAKIGIITIGLLRDLSEIKLKRTDTTLDLSQTVVETVSTEADSMGALETLGVGTYRQRELKKKRREDQNRGGHREIYRHVRAVRLCPDHPVAETIIR